MTINIYDNSGGENRMEFMNDGDNEPNVMPIRIVMAKKELWFNLSKDDSIELVKYLKKEFLLRDIDL